MSYCRWSSEDFACDLYCYADCAGGFTTHVAGNRVVGSIPTVPDITKSDIGAWTIAHNAQMDFMLTAERKKIGLPHDGETFNDPDLESFLDRLTELKTVGYNVPDWVIRSVQDEIADERTSIRESRHERD